MRGAVCGAMTTARRARPHAALSHSAFLRRHRGRICRRRGGTGRDLLDPHPLYGHAVPAGRLPDRRRRRARFPRRYPDRQFLIERECGAEVHCSTPDSHSIIRQRSFLLSCPICIWRCLRSSSSLPASAGSVSSIGTVAEIYPSRRGSRCDRPRPQRDQDRPHRGYRRPREFVPAPPNTRWRGPGSSGSALRTTSR